MFYKKQNPWMIWQFTTPFVSEQCTNGVTNNKNELDSFFNLQKGSTKISTTAKFAFAGHLLSLYYYVDFWPSEKISNDEKIRIRRWGWEDEVEKMRMRRWG